MAKSLIERSVLRLGAAAWRRRFAGRTLILSYHNVVPDELAGYGDSSLHIPVSRFRRHLDAIAEIADVLPLVDAVRGGTARRPAVVLTFDDAYRGAVTLGVSELTTRGWPGVIFVPPAFVPGRTFWWDDAARSADGLTAQRRAKALTEFAGRDEIVRAQVWSHPNRPSPDEARCASEAELTAAIESGAIALGSHTWSHPNLTRLGAVDLRTELEAPLAWLKERFSGCAIPWLSYPYGLENPTVRAAARGAGYLGAFRVSGGWLPRKQFDPFGLPRLNVPAGLSAEGLEIRLSGLLS